MSPSALNNKRKTPEEREALFKRSKLERARQEEREVEGIVEAIERVLEKRRERRGERVEQLLLGQVSLSEENKLNFKEEIYKLLLLSDLESDALNEINSEVHYSKNLFDWVAEDLSELKRELDKLSEALTKDYKTFNYKSPSHPIQEHLQATSDRLDKISSSTEDCCTTFLNHLSRAQNNCKKLSDSLLSKNNTAYSLQNSVQNLAIFEELPVGDCFDSRNKKILIGDTVYTRLNPRLLDQEECIVVGTGKSNLLRLTVKGTGKVFCKFGWQVEAGTFNRH